MRSHSSFLIKAVCALLVAVCAAAQVGEIIAQEQTSPLDLRHGYRMVLFNESGQEITWEQFQTYDGQIRWEIRGEVDVSAHAKMMLRNARAAGARGNHTAAIDLLQDAQENAPGWLDPIYEMAWTYMMSGDIAAAEKHFHRVNQLEPHGFMNAQQAEDCLRRERGGEVKAGTYQRVVMARGASPGTALLMLRGILNKTPDYAAAWEQIAGITDDREEARKAVETGLANAPDPYTRDALLVRRAILAYNDGHTADAVNMLRRQLREPDLTLAVEAQIKVLLPGMRRELETSKNKKQ